jgi:hydrogenase nickel incorporation protein HypB
MCKICGCDGAPKRLAPFDPKAKRAGTRTIKLEQNVLAKNDPGARSVRQWLAARHITAVNIMSSPGAGKTTLLERTIRDVGVQFAMHVIEGDQQTDNDAARVRAAGAKAVQINTGVGCHLDATMVRRALDELEPPNGSCVMIENVGNLVCPALFDLGEHAKVVLASVTEGEDKPLKYPHMFRAGTLLLLNKIDLLPYVQFDVQKCLNYVKQINPSMVVIPVSATRGDGLGDWYGWLRGQVAS